MKIQPIQPIQPIQATDGGLRAQRLVNTVKAEWPGAIADAEHAGHGYAVAAARRMDIRRSEDDVRIVINVEEVG